MFPKHGILAPPHSDISDPSGGSENAFEFFQESRRVVAHQPYIADLEYLTSL